MKEKIITAEEWFNQYGGYTREEMLQEAINFAKFHAENALLAACEKVKMKGMLIALEENGVKNVIDKNSILNAYDLENIK